MERTGGRGVDEPGAASQQRGRRGGGGIELVEIVGRDREVGVEDHQELVRGLLETESNGIALPDTRLQMQGDAPLRIRRHLPLDLLARAVGRAALDEDELRLEPEVRR